jgi:hypothetical protein
MVTQSSEKLQQIFLRLENLFDQFGNLAMRNLVHRPPQNPFSPQHYTVKWSSIAAGGQNLAHFYAQGEHFSIGGA